MGYFPETIRAELAGEKVECADLVLFDFTTKPMRLWGGNGVLKTNDGAKWQGLGGWGSASGIEQAINGEAPNANFTLSGIDAEIMGLARDQFEAEVRGRRVIVYEQFFGVEDPDDPDNQRCLDAPYAVWGARCISPSFAIDHESGERSVTIQCESLFSLRSRPRHAMYTDRDQQKRFDGDRGFEFVGTLVNKVLTWPDY